mmetsp:Transcript_2268/g.7465  ORF Transcript_2268/g.7465 Transcript_2268/m.7465 type:complete len:300 (+) Transcript_2268:119-1018(+)
MSPSQPFCDDPAALHEGGLPEVKLHPTVLFAIADHSARRAREGDRAIGALLGTADGASVDVAESFPVPHSEAEQATIDPDFFATMAALHRKVHPKHTVLGWYATGSSLVHNDQFYHAFFQEQAAEGHPAPVIFLLADLSLSSAGVTAKAYVRSELHLAARHVASAFIRAPLRVAKSPAERVALDHLVRSSMASGEEAGPQELVPLTAEVDSVHWRTCRLLEALDKARAYCAEVAEGKRPPDAQVGRQLHAALSAIPQPEPEVLGKMLESSMQDMLMVTYLSNLTRTQLALSEKLAAMQL